MAAPSRAPETDRNHPRPLDRASVPAHTNAIERTG